MTTGRRLDRARGALLGTFVGDALGMPFERQPPDAIPERVEMVPARLGLGTYTDDTQMMIALAESLLARSSARVTHAHPIGVDAAVVQAIAIGAAMRGERPLAAAQAAAETPELRDGLALAARLVAERPPPRAVAASLGNGSTGHESVPTAIYAAVAHPCFEDAVTFAVRCGGDTDTIGAMAGAIAGAREGASAIPRRWLDALEDGDKGRSHVERLTERLVS